MHFISKANNLSLGEQIPTACAVQHLEWSWWGSNSETTEPSPGCGSRDPALLPWVRSQPSCHTLTAQPCTACARGKERDGKTCGGKMLLSSIPWLADGKLQTSTGQPEQPKTPLLSFQSRPLGTELVMIVWTLLRSEEVGTALGMSYGSLLFSWLCHLLLMTANHILRVTLSLVVSRCWIFGWWII